MPSKPSRSLRVITAIVFLSVLAPTAGCHNTARGIKADTAHALHKTGEKVDRAADKIRR
jgi:predicted small secreted protein